MMRPRPASGRRPGFTLIELLISMTMITVVGAAIVSVFTSQQRFVRAASDIGGLRGQLQTVATVLPADLRNLSTTGRDIRTMSDSSIEIRTTIATSVVCGFSVAGLTLTLAPNGDIASNNDASIKMRLGGQVTTPVAGDSVFIWDEGATTALSDDVWGTAADPLRPYRISTSTQWAGACGTPYAPAGNTLPATVLTIDGSTPLRASLVKGAAVRITRPVRYGLYQSPVDSQWYLGLRDASFADYQYVAGPFRAYAAAGISGLRFQYFDGSGNEILDYTRVADVARIEVVSSARSTTATSLGGQAGGRLQADSLRAGVAIRNRN